MDIFKKEIGYLTQALEELEDYLLSDILYFPLFVPGASNRFSKSVLTIGNVLLSLQILDNDQIPKELSDSRSNISKALSEVETRWKMNWEQKVKNEFRSRLFLWENFILDLEDEKNKASSEYITQVRHRVILALLMHKPGGFLPDQMSKLSKIDYVYNQLAEDTGFIWNRSMQPSFQKNDFWFLYKRPK